MVESSHSAVEGELDDGLHRRAELDLQSLRLDELQIFRRLLRIEREVVGGAEPLVEGDIGAELGHPGFIGLGPDVGKFGLQVSSDALVGCLGRTSAISSVGGCSNTGLLFMETGDFRPESVGDFFEQAGFGSR